MKQRWIFTGVAFALAMTMTGCKDNAAANISQQSSQVQTQTQTQTGDMSHTGMYAALMAAGLSGLLGMAAVYMRRRKDI